MGASNEDGHPLFTLNTRTPGVRRTYLVVVNKRKFWWFYLDFEHILYDKVESENLVFFWVYLGGKGGGVCTVDRQSPCFGSLFAHTLYDTPDRQCACFGGLFAHTLYDTADRQFICTGRERLIRSHSSARFCFEFSGNSN